MVDEEELNEIFENISNVFIERSIWGKNIRIWPYNSTNKKPLSFYNISNPHELYKIIMKYAEKNYIY